MDVLYVGDHKLQANQYFVGADSFQIFRQEVADYEPLRETLRTAEGVTHDHLTGPEAKAAFPRQVEELAEYDVLIISDLTRGTLEPHFQEDAIPGPNVHRVIREYVEGGGGLLYVGGWMTFQGYHGVGNWAGTPVTDVLPVEVLRVYDDRTERPAGGDVTVTDADHHITDPIAEFPPVYGYNETGDLDDGATSLATVDGHHLLATGEYGDGRSVAYASDAGPKWGLGIMDWDGYDGLFLRSLRWAAGDA